MEAFGRAHPRADAIQLPIRFPGQYEDTETGLHHNWNRFYSPATSASSVTRDLTRDARGRTTAVYRDAFAASPDVFGLRYGTFGRLSAIDTDGDGSDDFSYRYDDLGLRRSKSDVATGTSHRFHYTLSGALLSEASPSVSRDYIWVAGELIGVVSDGSVYHVATDHLGTPRRAYDGGGALAWAVDVEAFG
ncbi:MAG: hypothetical protein AAFZ38_08545, partial [Myxococcota bacterium]